MALSLWRGSEPRIRDGVRGEAISLTAAAGPETRPDNTPEHGYSTSGTYRSWSCTTLLVVSAPGIRPVFVSSFRSMTREKYLIPGLRVPVIVSQRDPSRFRIDWDDVPTIDELIARGDALFTDPDATRPRLEAVRAAAGLPPRPATSRQEPDGPSARVVSFGGGGTAPSPFTRTRRVDLLLSVAIPGRPRFGHRWLGRAPRRRIVRPGTDIPIRHDPEIDIPWDEIGTTVPGLVEAAKTIAGAVRGPAGVELPAVIRAFAAGAPLPAANAHTVRLEFEVQPPGGEPYAASVDQLLPDAIVATLAAGQRVTVKVAGGELMLWNTPHAAGGADPDTGRPVAS